MVTNSNLNHILPAKCKDSYILYSEFKYNSPGDNGIIFLIIKTNLRVNQKLKTTYKQLMIQELWWFQLG